MNSAMTRRRVAVERDRRENPRRRRRPRCRSRSRRSIGTPLASRARRRLRRHRAALRDDADAARCARALAGPSGSKVSAHAVDEIGEADAIGADEHQPAVARDRGDASCFARPPSPPSAKPEAKTTAPPAWRRTQAVDRVDDRRLGHDQHDRIDAQRQIVDRRHAGPAVDLLAVAADEMDLAGDSRQRSRLASTLLPIAPGSGEAPTMATERGRSRRADGRAVMAVASLLHLQAHQTGDAGCAGSARSRRRRSRRAHRG